MGKVIGVERGLKLTPSGDHKHFHNLQERALTVMCGKSSSLERTVSKEQIAPGSVFPSDLASDREYLGSPPDRRTREACPHHKYHKIKLLPEVLSSGNANNYPDTELRLAAIAKTPYCEYLLQSESMIG